MARGAALPGPHGAGWTCQCRWLQGRLRVSARCWKSDSSFKTPAGSRYLRKGPVGCSADQLRRYSIDISNRRWEQCIKERQPAHPCPAPAPANMLLTPCLLQRAPLRHAGPHATTRLRRPFDSSSPHPAEYGHPAAEGRGVRHQCRPLLRASHHILCQRANPWGREEKGDDGGVT